MFCPLGADNFVLSALKKSQRKDAIVLRVVAVTGTGAHCPPRFPGEDGGFQRVNLLEEPVQPCDGRTLHGDPYEISTVRLSLKRER
jgi:alpha-mannosidase